MPCTEDLAANTFAVVLAGGRGTRLQPLTRTVCKPALPFGAGPRIIDFALANCLNSGIPAIGVPTQYEPATLLAHLEDHWGPAALGRTVDVAAWPAEERAPRLGYRGTADAVYRNLDRIDERAAALVLVLGGDHVYRMDYRPMLERHCAEGADVTIGCVEIEPHEARHFGVLAVGRDGCIDRFVEKPRTIAEIPDGDGRVLASMGIYVLDADFLTRTLAADAFDTASRHDFGADILPRLLGRGRLVAHPLASPTGGPPYWRDVGTLGAYWRAHMELLGPEPRFALDDPTWPLARGTVPSHVTRPSATAGGGLAEDTLLADDGAVAGRVARSVLFDEVAVAPSAFVAESVLLPGASIGPGCRLRGVIVNAGCHVPAGTCCELNTATTLFEPLVLGADAPHLATVSYAQAR